MAHLFQVVASYEICYPELYRRSKEEGRWRFYRKPAGGSKGLSERKANKFISAGYPVMGANHGTKGN